MPIQVQSGVGSKDSPSPQLHLYLDPECSYELDVQPEWTPSLGQMMRRHITMVPSYAIAITLAVLAEQLFSIHLSGVCLDFNCALQKAETFLELTMLASLVEYILGSLSEGLALDNLGTDGPWENLLLRVALYCIGNGAVFLLGCLLTGATYLSAVSANRGLAYFGKMDRVPSSPGKQRWSPYIGLLVAGLLFLMLATCAAVALFAGAAVFAVRTVLQCSHQIAREQRRGPSSETCGWRLQLCLLHLWLWMAALGLPAALVWFRAGAPLASMPGGFDPLAVYTVLLLSAQGVLWQPVIPNFQGHYYRPLAWFFRALAVSSVLLCTVRMYRVVPLVTIAFVAMALQQLLSSKWPSNKAD